MFLPGLINQIRKLEIRTDRLVEEFSGGAYRSVFKGHGIEFEEVREYAYGDDVRLIDWNVSARMGGVYVKKFVEERELTVMFLVDVSASGAFGSGEKSKRNIAAELAALLAFSAGRNGDKVGLMMFSDQVEFYLPPRAGRKHALHLISEMLRFEPGHKGTNIALALQECTRLMKKRGVVFLISDLIAPPETFADELKLLSRKQDVIAVEISDPAEVAWPLENAVTLEDAESGETVLFNGSAAILNSGFQELEARKEELCKKANVDLLRICGEEDMIQKIVGFFTRRAQLRRR